MGTQKRRHHFQKALCLKGWAGFESGRGQRRCLWESVKPSTNYLMQEWPRDPSMAAIMGSHSLNWFLFPSSSLGSAFLCTSFNLRMTDSMSWLPGLHLAPLTTQSKRQHLFPNSPKQTPVIYPDWTNLYHFPNPESTSVARGGGIHRLARSGLCPHPWNGSPRGQPHLNHIRTRSGKGLVVPQRRKLYCCN